MKQAKWFIHPVFIFVLSTVALAISLFLYIYWYIGVSESLNAVILRYQLDANQFFEARTWVVILILSVLVGVILLGSMTIFIYNLKTLQLYRLQHSFINNFTHELKTPVTSLKLYLETFAKHDLAREDRLKYLGFMLQDVERLSANINSILNLARIENRVEEGTPTVVDLPEMIQRFVSDNRHIFHNCRILVEAPPGATLLYPVILSLFEMLLMNILTNAVKYNTSGSPRIDITFERKERSLLIHFRDNGIGMEAAECKRIFGKFYQARRAGQTPVGGSGIGLHLVQQIARLHKGRMIAQSDGAGKGSLFTLILPGKGGERKNNETD